MSWPDRANAEAALKKLDLLVVVDYMLTATAKSAHFIVPPPLSLEVPGSTSFVESFKYNGVSRAFDVPWAQYAAKVVEPPPGSDLLDEAGLFFRLAQHMGLELDWINPRGHGPHVESPAETIPFDMSRVPDTEELVEPTCRNSRIPLSEVRRHSMDMCSTGPTLRSRRAIRIAGPGWSLGRG
jgi:anaerobic selenocysteine-containing dehydrogenase